MQLNIKRTLPSIMKKTAEEYGTNKKQSTRYKQDGTNNNSISFDDSEEQITIANKKIKP